MKVLIISDTHEQHNKLKLEEADMIIHCGDFSHGEESFFDFISWFDSLKYEKKLLISGNHDHKAAQLGYEKMKELCDKKGIIYLENTSVVIDGIKFHGSPYTVEFYNWEFMEEEEDLVQYWDMIPDDTNVLITHGPQHGVLDKVLNCGVVKHTGSRTLSNRIYELKELNFHFFGHIHEEAGIKEKDEYKNYVSVNASSVYDIHQGRKGVKDGIVIEIY